ncbi:hypothetical protein PLCT1_00647 [Planctomycetaceae bacterium]|nr:hypothetical protein PLCT1_00647 [Planctomycetaceae bacterium]
MSGLDRIKVASRMFAMGWKLLGFRYKDALGKLLHLHAASLSEADKKQLMLQIAAQASSDT